MIAMSMK